MLTIPAETNLTVDWLELCLSILRNGELILYPTETFYALGIDPWNESARTRIYELKGREASKELPCIASDVEMVSRFCDVNHTAFTILTERFWPGPLTLVLPLRTRSDSIAIRVSSHPVAQQISREFQSPIVSTSANPSGEVPFTEISVLPSKFSDSVSLAIDAGTTAGGLPSTIVSLMEGKPKILRAGVIPSSQIFELL